MAKSKAKIAKLAKVAVQPIKKNFGVKPLGDRVLIKPLEDGSKEMKSASGIILPTSVTEDKIDRGLVIAVGEGRIDTKGEVIAPRVKAGDKVLFQWGDKVMIDGEEYFIVNETGILAITK